MAKSPTNLDLVSLTTTNNKVWTLDWTNPLSPPLIIDNTLFANYGEVRSSFKVVFFKDLKLGIRQRIILSSLGVRDCIATAEIRHNITPFHYDDWELEQNVVFVDAEQSKELLDYWSKPGAGDVCLFAAKGPHAMPEQGPQGMFYSPLHHDY